MNPLKEKAGQGCPSDFEKKMKDDEVIRLQVPGALRYIAIVRRAVDAVGERIRLSPGARAEVKLAVGEACNNAVLHARGRGGDGVVVIACRLRPDALEIDVTNGGNGFHPGAPARMPRAQDLADHGRGRALMQMSMDSVEYLSENGNTTVRLRKNRPVKP